MKRICVFCGSNPGRRPEYVAAARELGQVLARQGIGLVYGGGQVGMMGQLAEAVRRGGGAVTGVIPQTLFDLGAAHHGLDDLRVVGSMHERKALMAELSDAFIALPGGLGTLEELFEVLTWAQLGIHHKPCGVLNVCAYYAPLLDLLGHAAEERFIRAAHRDMLIVDTDPEALLARLAAYHPPRLSKFTPEAWALRDGGEV
jgi:uncharacterized protein (TIGR00730 family)